MVPAPRAFLGLPGRFPLHQFNIFKKNPIDFLRFFSGRYFKVSARFLRVGHFEKSFKNIFRIQWQLLNGGLSVGF